MYGKEVDALDLKIMYGSLGLHSPTVFYFAFNFCSNIKAVVFLKYFFQRVPYVRTVSLKGLLSIPKG